MCSCVCQKVIAHQMKDEAVPTTVKMWSCSANHPTRWAKVSRKCPHMFTLELLTLGVIPWSCFRRPVPTLLFRRSCVQWEEDLPTAQVSQDLHPRLRDYPPTSVASDTKQLEPLRGSCWCLYERKSNPRAAEDDDS